MLREAKQNVYVEGILSEVELETSTMMTNGKSNEYVRGNIVIKTKANLGTETKDVLVPINVFAFKLKKDGNPNPCYSSIMKVKNDFVSIASVGDESQADCISTYGAKLEMNEFFNADGKMIAVPRIRCSMFSKISKDRLDYKANFETEAFVLSMLPELDNDGVEIDNSLIVKVAIPGYGEKINVFDFTAKNPNVVQAVQSLWQNGDTVRVTGAFDFSKTVVTEKTDTDFGIGVEKEKTYSRKDLLILGGSKPDPDGYEPAEMEKAMQKRKEKLMEQKERDASKARNKTAPSQAAMATDFSTDLGF